MLCCVDGKEVVTVWMIKCLHLHAQAIQVYLSILQWYIMAQLQAGIKNIIWVGSRLSTVVFPCLLFIYHLKLVHWAHTLLPYQVLILTPVKKKDNSKKICYKKSWKIGKGKTVTNKLVKYWGHCHWTWSNLASSTVM